MTSLIEAPDAAQRERARRHIELAKREAAIVPDIPAGTPLRPLRRAAVIALNQRTLRLRTLVEGPRVYQLGTIGGREINSDEKRFFESLKLPTLPPQ